jgi:hypothetical protein
MSKASLRAGEAQRHPPSSTQDECLPDMLTEGIPKERVNSLTLQVVQHLFPQGIAFLALLLRYAVVKQFALPDWPEAVDAAMIQVPSLRTLAKMIGWSYDTVEKYVVVFCALGLLYKERSRSGTTLYFSLGRYVPPATLDRLDEIEQDYRPKAQAFARRVRRRFLAIFPALPTPPAPTEALADSAPSSPVSFNLPGALLDIERILRDEGIELSSEQLRRVRIKVAGTLRYRCTQTISPEESRLLNEKTGDFFVQKSPNPGTTGDFSQTSSLQKGRLSSQMVDSVVSMATRKSRLSPQTVDSSSSSAEKKSPFFERTGDFAPPVAEPESTLLSEMVDSTQRQAPQKGRLLPQVDGSHAQQGDFEAREEALNVNVITKIDSLNVNVRQIAVYLCLLFKEAPKQKAGFYTHLYEKLGCRSADLWLAALVETAQSLASQKTETPGRYFYSRCIELHQSGIPPRTLQLIQRFQQERSPTYWRLLEILQQQPMTGSVSSPPKGQAGRLPSQSHDIKLAIPRFPKEQPGMTVEDYLELKKQIKGPGREQMRIAPPYQQRDGSVIALVEDFLGHQRWICSLEGWQRCAATIRHSLWPTQAKKSSCGNYHGGGAS